MIRWGRDPAGARSGRVWRLDRGWARSGGTGCVASAADGLPDVEGGQAFGGFGVDGDVVDDGAAGAEAGPVDQVTDVVGRAFEDGFDPAVGQVSHPAGHAVLIGHALARVTEEDALDPAGDQDTVADHRA